MEERHSSSGDLLIFSSAAWVTSIRRMPPPHSLPLLVSSRWAHLHWLGLLFLIANANQFPVLLKQLYIYSVSFVCISSHWVFDPGIAPSPHLLYHQLYQFSTGPRAFTAMPSASSLRISSDLVILSLYSWSTSPSHYSASSAPIYPS